MSALIETLLNGLLLGALYGLFGLGLSLSLGVMRMINIAHGDFIVLGAYLASVVVQYSGLGPFMALLLVVPLMFAFGWLLQFVLLNRIVGGSPLAPLLLTFGLSIVLQNVLQEIFSADTRSLQAGPIGLAGVALGDIAIGVLPLLSAAASVLVFGATSWLIGHSHLGRQARAVATDPATARLLGVNDRMFFALVTGFVLAVTALAAVLYGVRTPFSPSAGPERLLFSFEAVVLGGLGKLKVAEKPLATFKQRIRELTGRSGGHSMPQIVDKLRTYILGWKGYFKLAQTPGIWRELDEWLRHRRRAIQLKHWKRGKTMYREPTFLGAAPSVVRKVAANSRRWWRNSDKLLNSVLTISYFDRLGVPRLS